MRVEQSRCLGFQTCVIDTVDQTAELPLSPGQFRLLSTHPANELLLPVWLTWYKRRCPPMTCPSGIAKHWGTKDALRDNRERVQCMKQCWPPLPQLLHNVDTFVFYDYIKVNQLPLFIPFPVPPFNQRAFT
jgi:hypothetical protein